MLDIKTGEIIEGDLPDRAFSLVKEWLRIHQNELLVIWNTQNFKKLPPLN